ncbi:MAG: hypothetical protein J6S49_05010 [Erysipelotrichaceae bacterium]|nr:hypothetical protein [Erysipelotrichaceae bacterium]MBP5279305.1 hypothetical protein [Erysipelotrichaceae bacterium]
MSSEERILNDDALKEVAGGTMVVIGTATVITNNLNIRNRASTKGDPMGQTNAPASYYVFEIVQNEGYVWYRISENMWIANDGTWVKFSSK